MLRVLFREPLSVFVLVGALLFAGYAYLDARATPPITLTAETRASLIAGFELVAGREATPGDIARIEREYIADELLFRDAIANGKHLRSGDIRAEMIAEMRLELTGLLPDPDDEQLVNHYAENLDQYFAERTITFRHVYFRNEPQDAADLLAWLQQGEHIAGDAFPQGSEFPRYGESILRGLFGQPYLSALNALPLGHWQGPLESARGWHFVLVSEREPAARLPFEQVRGQVEQDYLRALIQRAIDARVAELAGQYEVRIER